MGTVKTTLYKPNTFNDVPGSSPRSVNNKIDWISDKIPGAEKNAQQTRHEPHAAKLKILPVESELYLPVC